jgi:hypothetical protein
MAIANGTFEVLNGGEQAYHEAADDVRLAHASGNQRFIGSIEGDGSIEWLMCYLPAGGARMVGLQRIEGTLDGRSGTFMIDVVGDHDGKASKATWHVIEGSGTKDLAGISGSGGMDASGGPIVSYHLEYEIP